MKKKFTFLVAALALLAMFVQPGRAWGQTKSEVDDEMTASSFAATSTSYTAFTGVSITSDAVYAGKTAKSSNGGIQLRSSGSDCGIISTGSGGLVRKVSVEWESGTSNGRSLDIYGKNSAYSSASELYNANNQGTKLGSIVKGTSTELTISGDYEFIGMRSYNGAMYLTSITVTWETGGSSDSPSISAENVDIDYNATSGAIEYTINNPASGGVLTATTESNWLSIGTIGETVPFTCSANEGLIRTALITLTYTYGNDNVTKNVTVTQAANPNGPGSVNNPYTVAQARAAIDAGTGTQGVYATGIVSQIVTEYNSSWGNLTFNIVDQSGDEVFLQAYRCGGDEAQNVAVNDIVIVYGNLKLYQSNTETTYEFDSGCQVVSLEHPAVAVAAPTFSIEDGVYEEAQTVTLSCETDGASIFYTVDGTVPTNASTPYTTAINVETTTTIKAIAYVGEESSTVASATYTIIPVVNISSITEVGTTYLVRGTVVATNSRGFVMGDGTGYVYYYKGSAVDQSVGAMVKVSGTTGTYGQIIQFTNSATVTEATASNYNGTPEATLITEVPDYTQGYHLSTYLEFEGALAKSNSNYFITLGESQIQISYPTTDQGTALTALDGKNVHVKGYFTGINSSSKFSVMLESAEEVVVTEPTITVADATVNVPFDGGEGTLTVTYENITEVVADVWFCNAEGTADATYDWITAEINNNNNVDYLVEPNEGEARTAYFKVWAYDDDLNEVYSNLVTVTQAEYVAPTYAELPFEFVGGLAAIEDTDGLYQDGLGSDYSSAPKLKFNDTGDWLLLQFSERPGTLTFDIKGYSFSGGTFTVQTSEDGVTFTDLQNYTDDNFGNSLYSEEFTDLGENVRYIKWIYTEKSGGNVGLGNIALAAYVPPVPTITIDPLAIDAPVEGASGSLSMTLQAIVNNAVEIQWFDEDGETPAEYDHDWIVITSSATSLGYTIEANASTMERTAHFRAVGNNNTVLSELVNVTQAAAEVPQPTVTVTPAVTDLESAATSGSLDVTMTNLEAANIVAATFEFYHFDGETYTVFGEEEDDPNWLGLECGFEYSVITYSVLENTADEARSAYFKLIIESNSQDYVYSDMVTINQAAYVPAPPTADSWVLTDLADLTENDIFVIVGTDLDEDTYALPNNATTAAPATVAITVANGALTDAPAAELQWNVSGNATEGYTFYPNGDTESWLFCNTTAGSSNNNNIRVGTGNRKAFVLDDNNYLVTNDDYAARYLSIYNGQDWRGYLNTNSIAVMSFYKKVSAPVPVVPTVTVEPSSIAATAEGLEGNLAVTYANYDNPEDILAEVWFCDENGENAIEYDWIDAEIDDKDVTNLYYMIGANAGEARTAYFKVFEASEGIYSELVTVTQEAYVPTPPATDSWVLTDLADLTANDIFVIVGTDSDEDTYALPNNATTAAPAAVAITVANDALTDAPAAELQWNVSGNATEGYTFYPNGDTESWLFCNTTAGSSNNNNIRVGTGNRKAFVLDDNNYLVTNDDYAARYLSIYNGQDWRGYLNTNSIAVMSFYKKVSAPGPVTPAIAVAPAMVEATADETLGSLTITLTNITISDLEQLGVDYCDENGTLLTGENTKPNWINTSFAYENEVYSLNYTISANEETAGRVAYFKVYEVNSEAYSNLVTVTQAAFVPTPTVVTYSLVTDASQVVSGKHYIIASGIDGDVKAMGGQQTNNRAIVAVTAANNTIEAVDGLYEFVINGPQTIEEVPYFTIYDTEAKSTGYLYAAGAGGSGSNNHLKTRTTNASDDKGIWTIAFEGNKAIIEAKASGRNKIRYNANSSCFSCYASGQADVYLFVKDNDTDYEYYGCEITYSGENIPADETITVGAGAVMEFTNTFTNTDPANIIVEDGGQLVINSSNVAATVKKDIVGHNPNGKDGVTGYYLVSSPIGNVNPSAVGMTTGSYDLYKFDQSQDLEWVNYKSDVIDGGQFDLVSGQGYLYANNDNETLEFAGTIYAGNGEVTLSKESGVTFEGWNLVGNPFTQNAYINRSYYVMNSTGSEILADMVSQDNPIKPMQGIFVIANEDDEEMIFFKEPQSSSNNGGLTLNVSQTVSNRGENSSSLVDRAIVRFGDNDMLPKFQLNDNSTKVYIPMNGKDYAVVSSEAQGEMPVNFKAAESGTYTFSVDAAENDMSYLHLIDHLTGANVDLLATPSYTFEARDTDMAARFKLVFSGSNAGTSDNFAFISDGQIILGGVDVNSIVNVIDINGRILTSSRGTSSIATDHMPAGVYVLQLVNGNEVKTQKIIVK